MPFDSARVDKTARHRSSRALSLRTSMLGIALACIIPLLALSLLTMWRFAASEKDNDVVQISNTARALGVAVDTALLKDVATLRALGTSPALARSNLHEFYRQSLELANRENAAIVLHASDGSQILNTHFPFGEVGRDPPVPNDMARALAAGIPQVTNVYRDRTEHRLHVAVLVPVEVAGRDRMVLALERPVQQIAAILGGALSPGSWSARVIGRDGVIIAANHRFDEVVGRYVAPDIARLLAQPGTIVRYTASGFVGGATRVIAVRSDLSGWWLAMGVPVAETHIQMRRTVAQLAVAALLAIGIGALLALVIGRRVIGALDDVSRAAVALGKGDRLPPVSSVVREIDEVAAAQHVAARLLRQRARERDEAQAQLETRARYQQAIATLGQLAFENMALDSLLQRATEVIAEAARADISTILEHRPSDGGIIVRAGVGWPDEFIGTVVSSGDRSQAGYALMQDGPVVVWNLATEARFQVPRSLREAGAVSGMSVILRTKARPFGVLGVHSRTYREFNGDDVQFCQSVAYLLSTVLIRREDEAALRRLASQNAQFAAAIAAMASGVLITDSAAPDNPIIFANQAFTDITGYAPDEVTGRNCRFLQGPQTDRADVAALRAAVAERRPVHLTLRNYRKTGEPFWNRLTISPIREGDALARFFVGIVDDVSERVEAEERLRQAQKMEAVGQLTGGIAHDFNNLLTVVLGSTDLLIDGLESNAPLLEIARSVRLAAQRGGELTSRLLAFARQQPLHAVAVDINALAGRCADLMRIAVGEHIDIVLDLAPDLPHVAADPNQLESALLNLAVNSRDAMSGGGRIVVKTTVRALAADDLTDAPDARPGRFVAISVADTGAGMPASVLKKVFEPFFTTKDVGKGTGLGLSMVHGFIHQSGGHVAIESAVARGTTVTLYLPLACEHAAPVAVALSEPAGADRGDGETILVVEDDPMVARHVTDQLAAFGYRVEYAQDGKAALARLAERDDIDLVFSDVIMPGGLSGFQLVEEVRRLRPNVGVLLTSGYIESAMQHQQLGVSVNLLLKPYCRAELASAIRAALAGQSLDRC